METRLDQHRGTVRREAEADAEESTLEPAKQHVSGHIYKVSFYSG
jgi:hypothetical protein